ncbi:MAG TPA: HsdR family type I site-specific deoxyribonuclease, partial [Ignavibacteria bacterium]|nr:HsdR family type I site-specific deoxyribonuclease [Ignavibacteria bacterium]
MQLEKTYLEDFSKKLEAIGWNQRNPTKLEGFIIMEEFRKKLKELNPDVFGKFDEDEIISKTFDYLQTFDEVAILEAIKYGVTILMKERNSNVPVTLQLIDYKNPNSNSLIYIQEQEFSQGMFTDRPDISLFVNGIPLVIIEGKNPLKFSTETTYYEGLKQIRRYQKEISNLFRFVQFGIGFGNRRPYMATFPCEKIIPPSHYSFWKPKGKEDILDFLEPSNLLDFVHFFNFFARDQKGNRIKILARYMQHSATLKAMDRIRNYLENQSNKKNGLVWHWQGSGKTFTMFFIANRFVHEFSKRTPLVFMTIDRLELQKQFEDVLRSVENRRLGSVKTIENIGELQKTIDTADKEWGMRIVTMQKFRPTELKLKEVDRKEVLFLVDEAHRSQYGDLASTMRNVFNKGMFFGFTGTPVFRNERNTFNEFSYLPEEIFLDVYFISRSQEDGFTIPLTYRQVEDTKVNIILGEDEIKTIIEGFEDNPDGVEKLLSGDLARDVNHKLRKKINQTRVFLESEKRIAEMVKYLAKTTNSGKTRLEEDTENFRFKAMIVATNRKACAIYKQEMDKVFGPDFSQVVMSYPRDKDNDLIHSEKCRVMKEWDKDTGDANKKIVETFLKRENPKVLIVTDMLLTGFDAPILKVMYLDKPMFYHKLLQAVARVNRPHEGKGRGLIVDSVGLLQHIHKTLGTYGYLADGQDEKVKKELEGLLSSSGDELKKFKDNLILLKEN